MIHAERIALAQIAFCDGRGPYPNYGERDHETVCRALLAAVEALTLYADSNEGVANQAKIALAKIRGTP